MGDNPYIYIETQECLNNLVEKLAKASRIALDTEADSLHRYSAKVCLIQVASDEEQYLVDPLANINIEELLNIFSQKQIFLHGGDYDLRMLRECYGFEPQQPVFDTMLAAKLLGFDRLGLAALVEKYCGVLLSKQGQKSDWSRRPLTEDQKKYASDDTRYLFCIADKLIDKLQKTNRLAWHSEICERMVLSTKHVQEIDRDKLWRIKGTSFFDRKQLNMLKHLWEWREEEAKKINVPSFKVFHNKGLIDFSERFSSKNKPQKEDCKFPVIKNKEKLKNFKEAVKKALAVVPEEWPQKEKRKRKPSLPDCSVQINAFKNKSEQIAVKRKIPLSVLAPKQVIEKIVRSEKTTKEDLEKACGLMKWQAELLAPLAEEVAAYKRQDT